MTRQSAPGSLSSSFASGTDAVPMLEIARAGVTVPLVLGVALIAWGVGDAIYAGLGALLVVLAERPGTAGQRLWKAGAGLLAGFIAMALGPYTAGTGLIPFLVVGAFAVLSGALAAYGPALSFAGMQLLVQMAIAGGLQVEVSLSARLVAYGVGGGLALVGSLALAAMEHTDRLYGQRLRKVDADARMWRQTHDGTREERWRIDEALAEVTDLVRTMRGWSRKRRALRHDLLDARDRLSVRVTALWSDYTEDASRPAASDGLTRTDTPASLALLARAPWRTAAPRLFVGRLVACMLAAEALRQVIPLGHSYWIVLTVALVLKPDLASIFSRSLQRGSGTLLGVGLAYLMVIIPAGIPAFIAMGALCAAIPWTVRRNYAWFSVVITPVVILFLDLLAPSGAWVLFQRSVHTVLGCLIVLALGYLCWPDTWRPTARPAIAALCRSIATLIDARAETPGIVTLAEAEQRLSIARGLAALRARASMARGEPGPLRTKAAHWQDVVRALDDVLMAVLRAPRLAAPDATSALRALADTLLLPDKDAIHRLTPLASSDPLLETIAQLQRTVSSLHVFGS